MRGLAGAGARVVITDVMDTVLQEALEVGADRVINVAENPEELSAYSAGKGYFDVQFEASGNERPCVQAWKCCVRARLWCNWVSAVMPPFRRT